MPHRSFAAFATLALASTAFAQVEAPDYRIRAVLRSPAGTQWGSNQSLGNAEFRVQSRFLQLYYGGVHRNDEFKFTVQLDFTTITGFATEFPASPFNSDYDVYLNNAYVGRALMGETTPGVAELAYDSRHADLPTRPLPANFPDPVTVGDVVRIYLAAGAAPDIGTPLPAAQALITSPLAERFVRGDVNQDRKVDLDDFAFLAASFDPFLLGGQHIGPAQGDFDGDNLSTPADYDLFVRNWTDHATPPARPAPILTACAIDYNQDGNTDQDDIAFLIGVVSGEPNTYGVDPDLNQDGNIDQDDIAALIAGIAGAPCN